MLGCVHLTNNTLFPTSFLSGTFELKMCRGTIPEPAESAGVRAFYRPTKSSDRPASPQIRASKHQSMLSHCVNFYSIATKRLSIPLCHGSHHVTIFFLYCYSAFQSLPNLQEAESFRRSRIPPEALYWRLNFSATNMVGLKYPVPWDWGAWWPASQSSASLALRQAFHLEFQERVKGPYQPYLEYTPSHST
ncbi:hypothetical protein VTO42DRAFT_7515 [Malbranchea cinnamomea]